MREIKFRAWDTKKQMMTGFPFALVSNDESSWMLTKDYTKPGEPWHKEQTSRLIPMQFTGLLDKNGLQDLYEGDIIDMKGNLKGNIYENHKEETDLVIQGFGTATWEATNKEAMGRGCKYAK